MTAPARWVHTGYAQRIVFGAGGLAQAAEVVEESGGGRIMLVTTEGRAGSEDGRRLVGILGGALAATFTGVRPHVPTSAVEAALELAQSAEVDGIVSFGGGSCADLAKAVCHALDYGHRRSRPSHRARPDVAHVAIPTAYSGAELTPFFGVTDEAARSKSGSGSPTVAPVAVLYDPEVTLSTPPRVSAETGMNCIAHGVEVAYSPSRTPEAEALGLACVSRAAAALPAVVERPDDLAARTAMLVAAMLGGRSLQNATMGVHHGLAQLLGGRTGLPHGLVNAVLLAHAMRFNADAVPDEMRLLGAALDDPDDAPGAVARLVARLGLPARLSACGVTEEDVEAVARASQGSANVGANPRPVSEADARAILEAAY